MKSRIATIFSVLAFALTSCHDTPEYKNDIKGNFDALTGHRRQSLLLFEEKEIDWKET